MSVPTILPKIIQYHNFPYHIISMRVTNKNNIQIFEIVHQSDTLLSCSFSISIKSLSDVVCIEYTFERSFHFTRLHEKQSIKLFCILNFSKNLLFWWASSVVRSQTSWTSEQRRSWHCCRDEICCAQQKWDYFGTKPWKKQYVVCA